MGKDEHKRVHLTADLFHAAISKFGDKAIIIPSGGSKKIE
jgi:hypothetical protein